MVLRPLASHTVTPLTTGPPSTPETTKGEWSITGERIDDTFGGGWRGLLGHRGARLGWSGRSATAGMQQGGPRRQA